MAAELVRQSRSTGWYTATIRDFLRAEELLVVGTLANASPFDVTPAQQEAWLEEIRLLQTALVGVDGWLILEFDVPRLGSRIDAVVLAGAALIPIEFKVGASDYLRDDVNQAWDYALDLKNFHAASHEAQIFPLLVATAAPNASVGWPRVRADSVRDPRSTNASGLAHAIREAVAQAIGPLLDGESWPRAAYQPTPTIVEAAQALYARHGVESISRNDAGAINLAVTSKTVESIIDRCAQNEQKTIIFVTGVPGAGKTLVGLNLATRRRRAEDPTHAVFLSGNDPLVAVLTEALTRDEHKRRLSEGEKVRKGDVGRPIKQFIQNVHHWRDDGVRTMDSGEPPHDKVVIFDEAQRAWDLAKTADFMKRKKGLPGFQRSEPQFLIEVMNRHPSWAVVVCLVGGGQEIHTGEAGITTWLDAIRESFPAWQVHISPQLSDSEYAAGHALERLTGVSAVELNADLHLSASMRSFRSEKVSEFVKALLDLDRVRAKGLLAEVSLRYPIVLSRDLSVAKRWIRSNARGSERYGLVASSSAQRLKPHAVDVRVKTDPVNWFLGASSDTRSSYYLEDVATEYQIQGLELDWICLTWDADLRIKGTSWQHRSFKGKDWQQVKKADRRQFLINAYRVLLTRARQGMAIFVPPGDEADPTRLPSFYNETYEYLRGLGLKCID